MKRKIKKYGDETKFLKGVTLHVRDGSERPVIGEGSAAAAAVAVAVADVAAVVAAADKGAGAVEMEIEVVVLAEKVVAGETVVVVVEERG